MSKNIRSPQVRNRRKAKNRVGRKRFESKAQIIKDRAKNNKKQNQLKEKLFLGELAGIDNREVPETHDIPNVATAHEIMEKLWLEDMRQALFFIKKHVKSIIEDEQANDIFTDSMFQLDEKYLKTRRAVTHESARKILYGIMKIEIRKFNWEQMLENMDKTFVSSTDSDGKEMYTEDEIVSSRVSDVEVMPPSYYFLKKYNKEQYRKKNPGWKQKKITRLFARLRRIHSLKAKKIQRALHRMNYYIYYELRILPRRERRARKLLHQLNYETRWDKINHDKKWFWLQEYRKLDRVKEYIRTYEKQYRQRQKYKQWSREYQRKKRQLHPRKYRDYSKKHYWKNPEESRRKHKEWASTPEAKKKAKERRMKKYYEMKNDPVKWQEHLNKINERKKRLRREKRLGIWKDRRLAENKPSLARKKYRE